jgi:hypothetical protein
MMGSTPVVSLYTSSVFNPYDAVVSPIGLSTSGVTTANNGADFGPDTPGTTTCGVQEALNSLPNCTVNNKSLAQAYSITGQTGSVRLLQGVFSISSLITIPAGDITIEGAGMSSWIPPNNIAALTDLGGTAIVTSDYADGLMTCPVDSHGFPATMFCLRNLDLRTISPGSAQTSSTPAILKLTGWKSGEMCNVNVIEAPSTTGTVGGNLYRIIDCSPGGSKDTTEMRNVRGFGGNIAVTLAGAHITAIGVTGGQTSSSITSNSRGLDIQQNLGCYFANLHAFSCKYGLGINTYFGRIYTPLVIHGIMFEAINSHYLLNDVANMVGTVVLENPCWNTPSLDPTTDIPATMPATTNIITSYEQDETGDTPRKAMHVSPASSSVTAGTSPYTLPIQPYGQTVLMSSANGVSGLSLDGQPINTTANIPIPVNAGHSLVITWSSSAPVFTLIPD